MKEIVGPLCRYGSFCSVTPTTGKGTTDGSELPKDKEESLEGLEEFRVVADTDGGSLKVGSVGTAKA